MAMTDEIKISKEISLWRVILLAVSVLFVAFALTLLGVSLSGMLETFASMFRFLIVVIAAKAACWIGIIAVITICIIQRRKIKKGVLPDKKILLFSYLCFAIPLLIFTFIFYHIDKKMDQLVGPLGSTAYGIRDEDNGRAQSIDYFPKNAKGYYLFGFKQNDKYVFYLRFGTNWIPPYERIIKEGKIEQGDSFKVVGIKAASELINKIPSDIHIFPGYFDVKLPPGVAMVSREVYEEVFREYNEKRRKRELEEKTADIRQWLLEQGFKQSENDLNIYVLSQIQLGEAALKLGFSLDELKPVKNVEYPTRTGKIKGYRFIVTPLAKDKVGNYNALGRKDTLCTIKVSLRQVKEVK